MPDYLQGGMDAIRQRMPGPVPGTAQPGKPPLASFHESTRLLPNAALKALLEAGVNLENPSVGDQPVIDDIRQYNKLPKFPWPKPPKAGAVDATPGGSPRY